MSPTTPPSNAITQPNWMKDVVGKDQKLNYKNIMLGLQRGLKINFANMALEIAGLALNKKIAGLDGQIFPDREYSIKDEVAKHYKSLEQKLSNVNPDEIDNRQVRDAATTIRSDFELRFKELENDVRQSDDMQDKLKQSFAEVKKIIGNLVDLSAKVAEGKLSKTEATNIIRNEYIPKVDALRADAQVYTEKRKDIEFKLVRTDEEIGNRIKEANIAAHTMGRKMGL